jgi:hypothetical protein
MCPGRAFYRRLNKHYYRNTRVECLFILFLKGNLCITVLAWTEAILIETRSGNKLILKGISGTIWGLSLHT